MSTFVYVPPPEKETPAEFAAELVRDSVDVMREPAIAIAGVAVSLIPDVVLAALQWPFGNPGVTPVRSTLTTMLCLSLAKGWLVLTVSKMGLAYLRREPVGFGRNWLPVQTALRIAVVNIPLLITITLATFVFVVPGAYLLAMWSQAPMAMADDRAQWFDAANYSASLTDGYKVPILALWLIVSFVTAAIGTLIAIALPALRLAALVTPAGWLLNAAGALFGAALMASMYYNLDERAPWRQR